MDVQILKYHDIYRAHLISAYLDCTTCINPAHAFLLLSHLASTAYRIFCEPKIPFLLLSVVFEMPNSSLPIPQKLTTHTATRGSAACHWRLLHFQQASSDSVHMLMEINIALVIADSSCVQLNLALKIFQVGIPPYPLSYCVCRFQLCISSIASLHHIVLKKRPLSELLSNLEARDYSNALSISLSQIFQVGIPPDPFSYSVLCTWSQF